MALSLGSALATRVYLGATEINLAYFGATQVYTSSAFSAEAQNYFDRLDTAGDTTYTAYKQPLANYIDSLVALGGAYWDDMKSSTSFVGVGIQGVTVPLRDGMTVPTQNNFVPGDLDQLTGLKGNGSTKDISTGVNNNDNAQNDLSVSTYVSDPQTTGLSVVLGTGNVFSRLTLGRRDNAGPELFYSNQSGAVFVPVATEPSGFYGHSRSDGSGYAVYYNGSTTNTLAASQLPLASPITVFSGLGAFLSSARLATYHIGPAIDLATLEGLQETLLSEIRTAHTFVAAASYFSRLAAAGDTTHVAYKQPLTNYITSLVELGGAYWDDMGSAASFVGVGIQGVTVPLKSTMTALTNNNFVAGDLDPLTGLKGDASTKYLDTGSKFNDFPQDDFSMSANITEFIQETTNGSYLMYQSFGNGISQISTQNDQGVNPNNLITRCNTRNGEINFDIGNLEDFYGINRTVSTEYSVQYGASSKTVTESSQAPANQIISIFGASTEVKSNARMATYHIGPALNLATLRGLQETLLSEVAAAKGAAAAANYFARLDTAGDTTYVPYKQPLTNYISSLVALGGAYWDDMLSAASFVGVGIQGITVPLRDGMTVPTNNNFVAGDLDQLTGLKGDGTTKTVTTGLLGTALAQNDASISCYITNAHTTGSGFLIADSGIVTRLRASTTVAVSAAINSSVTAAGTAPTGLFGANRPDASNIDIRNNGTTYAFTKSSVAGSATELGVFGKGSVASTNARLATYHAGSALNLATLEGLQDTLITEIAAI